MNSAQEKKSSQSFWSILEVGTLEIVSIIFLVVAILFTLNYFNIIPLSNTFSFLSFLPQQGQVRLPSSSSKRLSTVSPSPKKTPTIQYLVTPNDPKKFTNNSSEYHANPIPNSEVKVLGSMRIEIEMAIEMSEQVRKSSDSSALLFHNGLSNSKKDYRFLRLFYWPRAKSWMLHFQYAGKSEYLSLLPVPFGKVYGKFVLNISSDGRQVDIFLPTGEQKTLRLPTSLYATTNKMQSTIQVAPQSRVEVSSFSYQY